MSKHHFRWSALAVLIAVVVGWTLPPSTESDSRTGRPDAAKFGLEFGTPEIQTIGALTFGPENLLLVGDSRGATVYAFDVRDDAQAQGSEIDMQNVDQKIAARLGTTVDAITIHDMAVHPVSERIYLSVTRGLGNDALPVLLRISADGSIEEVSMDGIAFSKTTLANAPAPDATDRRGRSLRTNTITDIAYADGQVYVAGLSNEEFASNFRRVPFPFTDEMEASSLEIFHVAHGRFETHAPVQTFMPFSVDGVEQILAAYTCTPLVAFPVSELGDGTHVKGKTIAELGWGNRPLDMIAVERDGKRFILIANNNRTVMVIDADDLSGASGLTEPLPEGAMTDGIEYLSLPLTGVHQMALLNEENFLILQRQLDDGSLRLRSRSVSRML